MLLMTNCIRDGECDSCNFEDDCLVRRMMYPKMEIRPKFMTRQDSEGYVLECEDTDEFFAGGQFLEFNLLLLGKTIVYFSQFLQAFHYLGLQGLGKDHVPFRVKCVTNFRGEVIVEGNNVYKENIEILMLADYVRYRLSRLPSESTAAGCVETLVFHSPLTLKYRGEVQKSFSLGAVLASLERRLYILNCFEGRREGDDFWRIDVAEHLPELVEQRAFTKKNSAVLWNTKRETFLSWH